MVDKGKSFGELRSDLSKAFDCLPHELLIAKSHSYGFSLNALRLIHSCLSNGRQRAKINENYRSWEEILFGVPLGSVLGPLIFSIFTSDLYFKVNEIDFASYPDDNTSFVSGDRLDNVFNSPEKSSSKLFGWFSNNQMKANPDKCHLLTTATASIAIKIKDDEILNSESEKLVGVTIRRNDIITSCIKRRRITTNLANPYFILTTFRTCSSVHFQARIARITKCELQLVTMVMFNLMTKKRVN